MARHAQWQVMTAALAIFVKTPGVSPVKTRLAAGIGAAAALRFHQLAAAATAEIARACQPWLAAYWAIAEDDPAAAAAWRGFASLQQGQGDLGERLHAVYSRLHARHGRVLLIGADAPQVTVASLQHALTVLDDSRTAFVVGDAADGGFWLFGGRAVVPRDVWTSVRYSQAQTGSALRQLLSPHGAVGSAEGLSDVDTVEDLSALRNALHSLSHPLPAQIALRQWLDTIAHTFASIEREA